MGSALFVIILAVSGCQTLSFYSQAIRGQYQLLAHRQPIKNLVADSSTPARLKIQLELVQKLRAFAGTELKLPVDGHYTKYVDVHRRFVVWNVEAAPEFSMEPKTWWYPLVGSLEYRGYFSERSATNLPHREKYLLLVIDFLRGLLDLHEKLVDQVEREFGPGRKPGPANRKVRRT